MGLPRHVPRFARSRRTLRAHHRCGSRRQGLPILLRQYAKIGGKLLGFNVDRKFSNVLDGLVVVDLRQTDPAVLDRYMGREAAHAFRKIHRVTATS